jgi:hypothetical protein
MAKSREKINDEIARVAEKECVTSGPKKVTRGTRNTRTGKSYTA